MNSLRLLVDVLHMKIPWDGTVRRSTKREPWCREIVPMDRGTTYDLVLSLYMLDGNSAVILVAEVREIAKVNGLRLIVGVLLIGIVGLLILLTYGVLKVCEFYCLTEICSLR